MDKYRKLQKVLRLYVPFMKDYKFSGYATIVGQIFASLATIFAPLYFQQTIDNLESFQLELAFKTFVIFSFLILFYRVINYIGDRFKIHFQASVMKSAGYENYKHLLRRSTTFYEERFSGKLINKFDKFLTAFEYLHDIFINEFLSSVIQITGIIIALWFVDLRIALIFLIWVIFQFGTGGYLISHKIPLSINKARSQSSFIGSVSDFITNSFTAIAFNQSKQELRIFSKNNEELYYDRKRDWNFSALVGFIISTLASLFGLVAIGVAIYLYVEGAVTIGVIVLVNVYLGNLRHAIRSLTIALDKGSTQLSNAYEMYEILQTPVEITDTPSALPLQVTQGQITFQNTTFNYTGVGSDEIDNLTLNIQPGESIGLVGHSGAGKSTIVKLLLRFVDPTSGAILIDDQDIKSVTQESLRQSIAYVPQEPLLFHRTLRENISYGKPEADMDEVIKAAKQANAHEFIESLPKGYDTLVGERGVKLSGGQRQRVAIARAILKDSPILLLDEATSSLDSKSEREIQAAIANLIDASPQDGRGKKTVIAIAHRLSTIQHLDRIIVLANGKIIEEGSHVELLEREGEYAELWAEQVGGFIE